jgi:hypothetical protein
MPEAIFCEGKDDLALGAILAELRALPGTVRSRLIYERS